jgi:hypothetical protein
LISVLIRKVFFVVVLRGFSDVRRQWSYFGLVQKLMEYIWLLILPGVDLVLRLLDVDVVEVKVC